MVGFQAQVCKRSLNELEKMKPENGGENIPVPKRKRNEMNIEKELEIDVESVDCDDQRLVIDTSSTFAEPQATNGIKTSDPSAFSTINHSPKPAGTMSSEEKPKNKRRIMLPPKKLHKSLAFSSYDSASSEPSTIASAPPPLTVTFNNSETLRHLYQNTLAVNEQRCQQVFGGSQEATTKSNPASSIALDLSVKARQDSQTPPSYGGSVPASGGLNCVALPTVCLEKNGSQEGNVNLKRPSVIQTKDHEEKRCTFAQSSDPDVQEHFRKSLSSTRVYGASAEVEDHFARALGSAWFEVKQALAESEKQSCTN